MIHGSSEWLLQLKNSAALDLDTSASVNAFRPCDSKTASKSRDQSVLSFRPNVCYLLLLGVSFWATCRLSYDIGHQSYTRGETQFHQVQGMKCSSSFSYG